MSLDKIKSRWSGLYLTFVMKSHEEAYALSDDISKLVAYAEACNAYFDCNPMDGYKLLKRAEKARAELEK